MSCSKLKLYGSLLSLAMITVVFQQCAPPHQFSSVESIAPEKAMGVGDDVPGSNQGPQSFDDDSNNPSDDVASNPPQNDSDDDMSNPPGDNNPPSSSPPSNSSQPSSPNQDVADNDDSVSDPDESTTDPVGPQNPVGRSDDGDPNSSNDSHVCSDEQGTLHACVVVCHIAPGNPAQKKEMFRSEVWVDKHLRGPHAARMPFRIGGCEENEQNI